MMGLEQRLSGIRKRLNDGAFRKAWAYSPRLAELLVSEIRMPKSEYFNVSLAEKVLIAFAAPAAAYVIMIPGCGGGGGGNGGTTNKKPYVIDTIAPVSIPEDSSTSRDVAGNFADPDGDSLTYSVSGFTNVQTDVTGSNIVIYSNQDYEGTETGTVRACDPDNACATTPLQVTFEPVPDNPSIGSVTMTASHEGDPIEGQVNASDPDLGDALTYSIVDNPIPLPGLEIEADTGRVFTTSSMGFDSEGIYPVLFRVTDLTGRIDELWYDINVAHTNQPPVITDIVLDQNPPQEGQILTGLIQGYDGDGDSVSCSLVSSTLPQIRVTAPGAIYSCSGEPCDPLSPDPLPAGTAGPHSLEVECSDPYESTTATKDFEVNGPPTMPTTDVTNYGTWEDPLIPLEFDVYGSVDPNGDSFDYKYDSSSIPPGKLDSATGHFSWSPDCSQSGIHLAYFYAEDTYGARSGEHVVTITVIESCDP